jgi:L-rhamnonate dehydratase
MTKIVDVRAYVAQAEGFGDFPEEHWILGQVASPLSGYEEYRSSRATFGVTVPATIVVQVEAEGGTTGIGVSTGGDAACWVVEQHLRRFLIGRRVHEIELVWDLMYRGTLFYGRKGLVLNAISAVDIALWDLHARVLGAPVHDLLGGAVHRSLPLYATTPRPDCAERLGFAGAKMPLRRGPAAGEEGLELTVSEFTAARSAARDDFFLAVDCWMALDLPYARRLLDVLAREGLAWLEEPLSPDDYWGMAELRAAAPPGTLIATGEHEATRWGFRLLETMGCCHILQPDIGWCGGLSELRRIAAIGEAAGLSVVPHGSSVFSAHFVITQPRTPFAEYILVSPDGATMAPEYGDLFLDEPLPVAGSFGVEQLAGPGFGVTLNPRARLARPHPYAA